MDDSDDDDFDFNELLTEINSIAQKSSDLRDIKYIIGELVIYANTPLEKQDPPTANNYFKALREILAGGNVSAYWTWTYCYHSLKKIHPINRYIRVYVKELCLASKK